MIVDARGLDLRPSMAPKILSASGAQIYGVAIAEQHFVTNIGLVGYHKDPEQAAASDRLGGNDAYPLAVKAEKVRGYITPTSSSATRMQRTFALPTPPPNSSRNAESL